MLAENLKTVKISVLLMLLFLIVKTSYPKEAWQIAEQTFPSVVLVVIEDEYGQAISLGSGFFVGSNIIATNSHLLERGVSGYAKVVGDEKKYNLLGYIGIDLEKDLVLLQLDGAEVSILQLGDSSDPAIGQEIYAIGNPLGLEGTISEGIISGIRMVESATILQITAPISPGSSGGPVLNNEGEVIGIAFATFAGGQNLNFAIPVKYLRDLLKNLHPPRALSELKKKSSILLSDFFKGDNSDAIVADNFLWNVMDMYSFTLRNRLRVPVKNIYCLVIFYDKENQPIDLDVVYYEETVPGGLARRVKSFVSDYSVKELTTRRDNWGNYERMPSTKLEFRILDFDIVK